MALTTTIQRRFLEQKLGELEQIGFTHEYKATDDFWMKRIPRQSYPCELVYLCGQRVVRLWATGYSVIDTPADNGVREVVKTPKCYAVRIERLPTVQAKMERW